MVEMDDDWEMDNGMGGGWIAAITPLDEDNPLILIQDHTESSGELGEESRPIGEYSPYFVFLSDASI